MAKKEKFVDDGRVIAPMDVDGMPHVPKNELKLKKNSLRIDDKDKVDLTPEERRQVVVSSIVSAAVVALIFIGIFALVVGLIVLLG